VYLPSYDDNDAKAQVQAAAAISEAIMTYSGTCPTPVVRILN
jgi:hypothetical protein